MPRTYIKKKIKAYTQEDLNKALEEVKNDELSLYAASKKYKIPTTTLFDRMKGTGTKSVGRPQAIPIDAEKRLAEAIRVMEKWGFGLSRLEILEMVEDYVKRNNLQTVFRNKRPGTDWFINFCKRHRLSIKKPQPVEYVRKKMTDPFVIFEYFDLLQNTLTDLDLLQKPHLIWNLDETSLCLDPTKTKVVGAINKPCSRTTYGTGKENITILAAASAAGIKMSPLIVFKGKNVWDQWMTDSQAYDFEIAYAASTKGWMESQIFYNYLDKIFIPALGEERPILLVYDGHSTHVDANVVDLAVRHNTKSLSELCLDVINDEFNHNRAADASKLDILNQQNDFSSEYVTFLSQISKKAEVLQPFATNKASDLPECLRTEKPINIISDIKVNFEDLLLEKIQQDRKHNLPVKKKRVAKGAEVITLTLRRELLEEKKNETSIEKILTEPEVKTNKNRKQYFKAQQLAKPGPSKQKEVKKVSRSKKFNSQEDTDNSTSISEIISLYSDIDIDENSLPEVFWDADVDTPIEYLKLKEEEYYGRNNNESDISKNILGNLDVSKKEKGKGKGKKSKRIDKNSDIENKCNNMEEVNGNSNKTNESNKKTDYTWNKKKIDIVLKNCVIPEKGETESIKDEYMLNDSVLVRYYSRKKWSYYIGFIEKIIKKEGETYYAINFLKTLKRPQLTFVITRKKDYDEVNELMIVKKVKLEKNNDNYREYVLSNENDQIYF